MKRSLPILVLILTQIGCKSEPVAHVKVVADSVPAGWTLVESADGGVRVGVPSGWRFGVDRMGGFDMSAIQPGALEGSETLKQMGQDLQRESEEQEKAELAKLAKKGIVVNVISELNRPIIGEARTRYYVLKTTRSGSLSLPEAAGIERDHYASKPEYQTIQLPIGEAIRCEMTDKLRDGGELTQISYVVVDGDSMYSLRFVTQENPQVIEQIADPVAQSWRIKPG